MATPVYVIAQIDVKDYQTYLSEYGYPLLEHLAEIGAEVLATDAHPNVLEGEWAGNWVAIIKFPSAKVQLDFYNSPQYEPLKKLRMQELSRQGVVVVVNGLDAGSN